MYYSVSATMSNAQGQTQSPYHVEAENVNKLISNSVIQAIQVSSSYLKRDCRCSGALPLAERRSWRSYPALDEALRAHPTCRQCHRLVRRVIYLRVQRHYRQQH